LDAGSSQHGDTGGVVATVFQALQTVQHDTSRAVTANISNNSTHISFNSERGVYKNQGNCYPFPYTQYQ
jgi:hypothetical protein